MSLNQRLNQVVNLQWTKPKDRAESFLIEEVFMGSCAFVSCLFLPLKSKIKGRIECVIFFI